MRNLFVVLLLAMSSSVLAQTPPIEPGVSHELAKWRAARYSDVRYELNLTLEKMSPVLKGTMEIRVKVGDAGTEGRGDAARKSTPPYEGGVDAALGGRGGSPIILDWRKIKGSENLSMVAKVSINGQELSTTPSAEAAATPPVQEGSSERQLTFSEHNEHLIFRDGVVAGENVIKLDFTSPILTSGSAITRYVDKEDGAEYIYSLFVPSDASTAFPVFDQPDLKAKFDLCVDAPKDWAIISNTPYAGQLYIDGATPSNWFCLPRETKPISTYVFAFAAGPFQVFGEKGPAPNMKIEERKYSDGRPVMADGVLMSQVEANAVVQKESEEGQRHVYVRKSQAAKFKPHAAEVFRLNREGVKFLEGYFDYKFPFPKYDLVLIPEFPFGGMEHAGATFLRESAVIFPQEPTKNDYISRANVIFHEAAHQWFGDTVTMKWFDDLWLKEGFAEFMAYKTLEKVMPEYNAWKVFYERNKQAAYLTDSTKGTTPIYQEIANLNAAKSAYGNIVYRKAPSFLKQAEFYIGPDKFQTAVRAFLKKHEFKNATWEDLVKEFQAVGVTKFRVTDTYSQETIDNIKENNRTILEAWAAISVKIPGASKIRLDTFRKDNRVSFQQSDILGTNVCRPLEFKYLIGFTNGTRTSKTFNSNCVPIPDYQLEQPDSEISFVFPNYQDYGYGIFLLDDKSRDYVLKNIHNEKDDFLRTMMWGSLWDSVREGELDPKEYVELVVKNLATEQDESTIQSLLGRVSTAMNYYLPAEKAEPPASAGGREPSVKSTYGQPGSTPPAYAGGSALGARIETALIDRMQNAATLGQRITFYRAFLNIASTEKARRILQEILNSKFEILNLKLKTKDRFDIVTRLLILGDPEAPKLLGELERTETSDEAKRYAYAAKAGIATAENKAKFWNDFTANKDISESWIEAAFGPFNSVRHADLSLPYLERALKELPNHKRSRKIFFVNGWLSAFIGGQRSQQALAIVNKFLADNSNLDKDLRLKVLENVDLIERAVRIRGKYGKN